MSPARPTASRTTGATGALALDRGRLVLPAGWRVDRLTTDRLAWQLARAPSHVRAVVAPGGPLRSGASYRTHGERASLQPLSALVESSASTHAGAALVRDDVAAGTDDGVVTIELDGGSVFLDHGTHAHDTGHRSTELRAASAWGRSPFPGRPVVLLLGLHADEAQRSWAATLTDELIDLDVEARLAVTDPAPVSRLTRPCTPSAQSVRALQPDVVVALDPDSLDAAAPWLGEPPCRVLAFDPGRSSIELAIAAGHRDARVDGWVGAAASPEQVATAVRRLCGPPRRLRRPPPPPGPPPDTAVSVADRPRTRVAVRRTVVLCRGSDEAGERRMHGLASYLRRAGDHAALDRAPGDAPDDATTADLLVVHGAASVDALADVVAQRSEEGRPSVLDLAAADLAFGPASSSPACPVEGWTDATQRAIESVGRVVTPSRVVAGVLAARDVSHRLVPTLDDGRPWPPAPDDARRPTIGWDVGAGTDPDGDTMEVIADALIELLDRQPTVAIEVVGDPATVPDRLFEQERFAALADSVLLDDAVRRWSVQLWTPTWLQAEVEGDRAPLVRAGRSGVPTVAARWLADVVTVIEPELVVEPGAGAAAWRRAVEVVLADGHEVGRFADRVHARTRAELGPEAGARAVHDLLTWSMT